MKRTALVVFALLLATQPLSARPWLKSVAAAQKEARAKNQLIFVDLFAEWCGWCHRMEQEVFPSEKFQKVTSDMILLRVDTEDQGEGSRMSRDFSVSSLPTFLVLTPDMLVAGMIQGYAPSAQFTERLTLVRQQYETFRQKVKQTSSKPSDWNNRIEVASEYNVRRGFGQAEGQLTKLLTEKNVPVDVRDQAYYQLAVSQFSQKKYDASVKTLQKFSTVQSKGPSFEQSRLLLGQIYIDQGKYKSALGEFRNFKRNYPASPLAKNVEMIVPQLEKAVADGQ